MKTDQLTTITKADKNKLKINRNILKQKWQKSLKKMEYKTKTKNY